MKATNFVFEERGKKETYKVKYINSSEMEAEFY